MTAWPDVMSFCPTHVFRVLTPGADTDAVCPHYNAAAEPLPPWMVSTDADVVTGGGVGGGGGGEQPCGRRDGPPASCAKGCVRAISAHARAIASTNARANVIAMGRLPVTFKFWMDCRWFCYGFAYYGFAYGFLWFCYGCAYGFAYSVLPWVCDMLLCVAILWPCCCCVVAMVCPWICLWMCHGLLWFANGGAYGITIAC